MKSKGQLGIVNFVSELIVLCTLIKFGKFITFLQIFIRFNSTLILSAVNIILMYHILMIITEIREIYFIWMSQILHLVDAILIYCIIYYNIYL